MIVVTRENKLALIVGFALILVVGVLVSDHLSAARHVRLDGDLLDESRAFEGETVGTLAQDQDLPEPVVISPPRRTEVRERPGSAETVASNRSQRTEQSGLGQRITPITAANRNLANAQATIEPKIIDQGSGPAQGDRIATHSTHNDIISEAERHGIDLRPVGPRQLTPLTETVERQSRQTPPPAPEIEYVVRPGDSLYVIAKRYLGEGERWREIRDLNRDQISSNNQVREGITLRLPAEAAERAIQQHKPASSDDAQPKPQRESTPDQTRQYTVQKNDTLGAIASAELGTIRRMGEILALNKDVLKSADQIYAGMKIKLPAE